MQQWEGRDYHFLTCLIWLLSVMICIFICEEFEDCIGLCNSHYCSSHFRISTRLYSRYYSNPPKVSGYLFMKNYHSIITLIYREFVFNFDVCCVSCKVTTYSCLHLSKKSLLMQLMLLVALERAGRFLTTGDAVL